MRAVPISPALALLIEMSVGSVTDADARLSGCFAHVGQVIPTRFVLEYRFLLSFIWSQTGSKLVADLSQTC